MVFDILSLDGMKCLLIVTYIFDSSLSRRNLKFRYNIVETYANMFLCMFNSCLS